MKVKVRNENTYPFTQTVRDVKYHFEPGATLEMEDDEAVLLLGAYSPIEKDGDDQPMPKSYKMLKIEYPGKLPYDLKDGAHAHKCIGCGHQATNAKELYAHVLSEHSEQMTAEGKEELEAKIKRKPGRPAKTEASAS